MSHLRSRALIFGHCEAYYFYAWIVLLTIFARGQATDEDVQLEDYYARDPVQILFGRYREDYENIRAIHFVIFGALFLIMVSTYLYYLRWRYGEYRRSRKKNFPDLTWMRLAWFKLPIDSPPPGQVAQEVRKHKLIPESFGDGNLAWSRCILRNPFSAKKGFIEHRRFIILAHEAIEILATQRLPNLKVENYRSLRVYMTAIEHNFNIDPETILAYIDLYERARFGSRASSEADFGNFVIILLEIMKNIRSGWNNSDEVLSRSTRSKRGGILQHKNRLFNAGGGRLRGLSGSSPVILRRGGGTHSSANSFVTGDI